MDVVEGRSTDFLRLPDGTIKHALSVIYPLRALPGLRQFRVIQQEDFAVIVQVCCDPSRSMPTREIIAKAVRTALGPTVPISVEWQPEIAVAGSGKYRYVESRAGSVSGQVTIDSEALADVV